MRAANRKWDAVVSHANLSKDVFAKPLSKVLQKCGMSILCTRATLKHNAHM